MTRMRGLSGPSKKPGEGRGAPIPIHVLRLTRPALTRGIMPSDKIMQKKVDISDDETVESLKQKVQAKEVECFIEAIKLYQANKIQVKEGKVKFNI